MSFSSEWSVPREIFDAFVDDRMALVFSSDFSFPEMHDEGDFIDDLEVYETAMAAQINGEHGEDVYDAGICRYSDFTWFEEENNMAGWYGGSYEGRSALIMELREETGNGSVLLAWVEDDPDPNCITLIIDVG